MNTEAERQDILKQVDSLKLLGIDVEQELADILSAEIEKEFQAMRSLDGH